MSVDPPVTRLTKELESAGIPVAGVSPAKGGGFQVFFLPEATEEHRMQAQTIMDGFDARPRKLREIADIKADKSKLSAEDKAALNDAIDEAMRAEFLQRNPMFAQNLGYEVPGDETIDR